ncbi:SPL family radical SAM protein [Caldalkalibacillus salinus]|uniref:SPL family radical SAM protein n=1 Tax=Caldalkalibacillus salinus TaxID=2803787 RepID=UPI001922C7AF|nr:radical SAM protein [Caldalkalibacillus salinus]
MNRSIQYKQPKKWLTPASGYLQGYSHTLNPYVGCAFSCVYCYVRRMPVALFRQKEWGTWVDVKEGASETFRKELRKVKDKGAVTIFMSSSTDPYQPIEYNTRITRQLLEVMVEEGGPDFLFLQTRSPLVTRDIDLLHEMRDRLLISVTVETDREDIRQVFSPWAPPIQGRIRALRQLKKAGLPVQAAVSPVLPCTERFADTLADHVDRVCLDDYFMGDGSKGKRTKQLGVDKVYRSLGLEHWYTPEAYQQVWSQFETVFSSDQLYLSQEGFKPMLR